MAGCRVWARQLGEQRPRRRRSDLAPRRALYRYKVSDTAAPDAVPVLRAYLATVRVVRPYFDAAPDAPDDALAAELPRHPVLRLSPLPG